MKKRFTLLVILGLCSSVAFAQRGLHLGFTAAPTASFIVKQNNYETLDGCVVISRSELDYTMKWGYTAGGVVGFNFNEHMGIQIGARYVRTGQNYEDTFNPGAQICTNPYNVVRKVDLRYVRIPLEFRYKFDFSNPKFKMYMSAGPYIGWLIDASESVVINDVARTDLTPTIDKFDYTEIGGTFSVGGEYFITRSLYMTLGLQTDFGLTDMNGRAVKDLEWFSKNDVGYRKSRNFNTGINVGFHYIFNPGADNPFKKKSGGVTLPQDIKR
jgi:hypothetical protein